MLEMLALEPSLELLLLKYSWSKRAAFRLLNQSKSLDFYPHSSAENGARFRLSMFSCNLKRVAFCVFLARVILVESN